MSIYPKLLPMMSELAKGQKILKRRIRVMIKASFTLTAATTTETMGFIGIYGLTLLLRCRRSPCERNVQCNPFLT